MEQYKERYIFDCLIPEIARMPHHMTDDQIKLKIKTDWSDLPVNMLKEYIFRASGTQVPITPLNYFLLEEPDPVVIKEQGIESTGMTRWTYDEYQEHKRLKHSKRQLKQKHKDELKKLEIQNRVYQQKDRSLTIYPTKIGHIRLPVEEPYADKLQEGLEKYTAHIRKRKKEEKKLKDEKQFYVVDLGDDLIHQSNNYDKCVSAFLERYPQFDRDSVKHWIYTYEEYKLLKDDTGN